MIYKEFDDKYNFWKLTCDEGEFITSWTEEDNVLDYCSFKHAYCPKDVDLEIYHTVTAEENNKLESERRMREKLVIKSL